MSNVSQVIYVTLLFPQLDPEMLERLLEGEEYHLLLLWWEKNMRGGIPPAGWRSFHDVYCNYSLITGCGAGSQNMKALFFHIYINLAGRLLAVISPLSLCSPKAPELINLMVQRMEQGDTLNKVEAVDGQGCGWLYILLLLSKLPILNNSFLYPASE